MVIDYKKLYKKYKTKYNKLETNVCKTKRDTRHEKIYDKIIDYHNNWWKSFIKEEDYKTRHAKYYKLEKYELHKYDNYYKNLKESKYINHGLRGELDNLREKIIKYKFQIVNLFENNKNDKNIVSKLKKLHIKNKNIYNDYPHKILKKLESLNILPLDISRKNINWDYNKIKFKTEEQDCKIDLIEIENNLEQLEFLIEFTLEEFDITREPI